MPLLAIMLGYNVLGRCFGRILNGCMAGLSVLKNHTAFLRRARAVCLNVDGQEAVEAGAQRQIDVSSGIWE